MENEILCGNKNAYRAPLGTAVRGTCDALAPLLLRMSLLLLVPLAAACDRRTTPSIKSTSDAPGVAANSAALADAPAKPEKQRELQTLRETWDAIYMGDTKVGYLRTRADQYQEDGQPRRVTRAHLEINAQRFGQLTTPKITFGDVATAAGELLEFSSRLDLADKPVITTGRVVGKRLRKLTQASGEDQPQEVAWDASWGGYFAPEESLRDQPMQPGEKRTIHHLKAPPFNSPGQTILEAEKFEQADLLDESRRLLKINSTEIVGGVEIEAILWADENGEILKQHMPSMQQTSYRTTRAVALGESQTVDLGERLAVRLDRTIADPHATQRIVYRARLPQRNPADVFAVGAGQTIEPIDEQSALIDVRAVRAEHPVTEAAESERPTAAERSPNTWIQSSHPQVVALAGSVAEGEEDPWKVACALEQLVEQTVENKNFSQAFATAADVAEQRAGDCTEHAVLLAALLRAREIPARVAIGLVYFPVAERGAMAYHMWTEAWITDRWVPLDGTLGRCGTGAAHLKITHSHLGGDEALLSYLKVNEVLGQLELEIVEVK